MADTAVKSAPAFVAALLGLSDEDRKSVLQAQHPDYASHVGSWQLLLDAFEGDGGFLDGSYLWPYPREDDRSFRERQQMARYHNYLETLVDLYVRFIFTQGVRRSSDSDEFNAWLKDVDGAGTEINDFLKRLVAMALVTGHAGVLVDKTADAATGPTRADETAEVVASIFTSTAIPDWRFDGNALAAVKLTEAAPEPPLTEPALVGEAANQYLLWDDEGWARFDVNGTLVDADVPDLGLVPFVVLRPKPSQRSRLLGRALVSNANVVRALFNRASEEDQVIRDQAFSVLTVSVHPEGDLDQVKASLGSVIGTAKALVVKGEIKYETPDQAVPGTIRDNSAYLVQEMYRAAHVRFKRDSLAAESGEAIRLQYAELNEMLQGLAKEMAKVESHIARCWFAWTEPTPEAAQKAFEAAAPDAVYPDEFFLDSLINDLKAWAEAIALDLGLTMAKRIKKRAVRRLEPDMATEDLKAVDAEIDAQTEAVPLPPASDFGGMDPNLIGGAGAA